MATPPLGPPPPAQPPTLTPATVYLFDRRDGTVTAHQGYLLPRLDGYRNEQKYYVPGRGLFSNAAEHYGLLADHDRARMVALVEGWVVRQRALLRAAYRWLEEEV